MTLEIQTGNLLESEAEALVNTVNTVGVMGKGIALMFKEAFPENFKAYKSACNRGDVRTGHMFVFERDALLGPRWIINFPTKQHWRNPSNIDWIKSGLRDLKDVVRAKGIRSVAIPPLGAGNGGLDWADVRPLIEATFAELPDVSVELYEPTRRYHNVAKRAGKEQLTPPRALMAALVREYWSLGIECSILEVQKLGYFAERFVEKLGLDNSLDFKFKAHRFGPYSDRLKHLLDALDGSYLHCAKRLADADPQDVIWFDEPRAKTLELYLKSQEGEAYGRAFGATETLINGFQSPLGMELLATIDWLVARENVPPTLDGVRSGLKTWPGGQRAGERKQRLFDDRLIGLALERLNQTGLVEARA